MIYYFSLVQEPINASLSVLWSSSTAADSFIPQRPHAALSEIKDKTEHQQNTYSANLGRERC